MTIDGMDIWFKTLEPRSRVDGVSMLDGYLTAIVIGPDPIPRDEWLGDLLGERGRSEAASGQTLTAIGSIAARFDAISDGLSMVSGRHAPIFEKSDGVVMPQPWCIGFHAAMQLRMEKWRPLLDLQGADHLLVLPILLHCTDELGEPLLGPSREGPEAAAFLRDAYQDIPFVILKIRDFWMARRNRASRHRQ